MVTYPANWINAFWLSHAPLTFTLYIQTIMPSDYAPLIRFLQEELAIPPTSIKQALKQCREDVGPLPMILWQQGVVTVQQLERIFDWMEMA